MLVTRADQIVGGYPKQILGPYIFEDIVTIVSGAKSSNKSTLLTFLAAALSRGTNAFDRTTLPGGSAKSIIYSLEDSKAVTTERLKGMGAKTRFIHVADIGDRRSLETIAAVQHDIETIKPKLVVIDSLSAFFGSALSGNKVQEGFSKLQDSATKQHCAVIIIHHPPKQISSVASDWCGGTGRITANIRAGFYVHNLGGNKRRWMQGKYQYGRPLPSFDFTAEGSDTSPLTISIGERGDYTVETFHWKDRKLGECSECGEVLECPLGCKRDKEES